MSVERKYITFFDIIVRFQEIKTEKTFSLSQQISTIGTLLDY